MGCGCNSWQCSGGEHWGIRCRPQQKHGGDVEIILLCLFAGGLKDDCMPLLSLLLRRVVISARGELGPELGQFRARLRQL